MKKKNASYNGNRPNPNQSAIGRSEKDIDDLVHSDENETTSEQGEEDLDDKAHRLKRSESSQIKQSDTNMEDPDDLVHGYHEKGEE